MDAKKISGIIAIIAIVAIAIAFKFSAMPFKDDFLSTIPNLIGLLFFASLLLERALDVLLTLTRAPKSEELDEVITDFQFVLKNKSIPSDKEQDTQTKLAQAQAEKRAWRNGTRSIAMWLGLILGIIIAAVGIRTLGAIIEAGMINNATQRAAFAVVDILLTGGLLAGGSDGIHKIAELYRNFFESQSAQARQKTLEQKSPKGAVNG